MILSTSRCPPWWESAGAATSKQGWLVTSAPSQPQRQMAPTHLELESAHTWWGREICSGVCFPVTFRCGEATRLLLKIKMKNDVLVALYILQKITIFNGRIYIIKNKIFWEISHAYNWDFFNREVMSIKYNWENMTYLIFFFGPSQKKCLCWHLFILILKFFDHRIYQWVTSTWSLARLSLRTFVKCLLPASGLSLFP